MYKLIINGYQWAFETQEQIVPWILQQNAYGKHERPELDENGQPTGNILPAEYTYEIIDMTAEIQTQKESAEALEYLKSTDWYIIREMDSGVPCPQEIKDARAAARLKVI